MFTKLSLISSLLLATTLFSPAALAKEPPVLYKDWQIALKNYVGPKEGLVAYGAWKKDQSKLDSFLNQAKALSKAQYTEMNRDERIAFWINVYNAFTVKQILNHYPIKRSGFNFYPGNSIRQINGVWTKYKLQAGSRVVSLSDIENKILRKELDEPLIHFAINCASKSCPKLQNTAYKGASLRNQLNKAVTEFLHDKSKNRIGARKMKLSKIFDWYKDDFQKHYLGRKIHPGKSPADSAILNFLSRYKLSTNADISYMPYDWSLNERKI